MTKSRCSPKLVMVVAVEGLAGPVLADPIALVPGTVNMFRDLRVPTTSA